jgi:hypothetical protein
MIRIVAVALVALSLALGASAQAQGTLAKWTFDEDTTTWQSIDPAAKLQVTKDQPAVRIAGMGVAEYAYEVTAGKLAGVMTEANADLSKAKSLRFWLRASTATVLVVTLAEKDGSNYIAAFSSLPDVWQDISLDLSGFALSDDSQDENNLLDPGQIASLGLVDVSSFLVDMAAKAPFMIPPELGPRKLWLDDVSVDTEPVLPRWETVEVNGLQAVRLESFESMPLQWMMISGGAAKIAYDDQMHTHGNLSLRLTYDLPAGKLVGMLTGPATAPIAKALRLRLSVRSEAATTLMVGLKEKDGSQYNYPLPVTAGQEMHVADLPLTEFKLGDDSTDENGKLDLGQVSELQIMDMSGILGQPVGHNTLWLDDILFIE